MLFLYDLMKVIGYFLIMIIFMVIAIITAKGKTVWIWYVIGAILQLLSLLGNQKNSVMRDTDITIYWIIYVALLVITAILINKRRDKSSISDKLKK